MTKKILKIALTTITAFILFSVFIQIANAYSIPSEYNPANVPFTNTSAFETSYDVSMATFILQMLAGTLIYFAAPVAILLLVIAGVTMIVTGADTEKAGAAKKHITWIIIGLIVIIFSYAIVRAVIDITIKGTETPAGAGGTGESQ